MCNILSWSDPMGEVIIQSLSKHCKATVCSLAYIYIPRPFSLYLRFNLYRWLRDDMEWSMLWKKIYYSQFPREESTSHQAGAYEEHQSKMLHERPFTLYLEQVWSGLPTLLLQWQRCPLNKVPFPLPPKPRDAPNTLKPQRKPSPKPKMYCLVCPSLSWDYCIHHCSTSPIFSGQDNASLTNVSSMIYKCFHRGLGCQEYTQASKVLARRPGIAAPQRTLPPRPVG